MPILTPIRSFAILTFAVQLAGCAAVELPAVPPAERLDTFTLPVDPPARGGPALPVLPLDPAQVAPARAGMRNDLGVTVSAELAPAYGAHARGDADALLAVLDAYDRQTPDTAQRWSAGVLRYEALILLGRVADAEVLTAELARDEQQLRGHDLLARSLRGLARMEYGDLDGALTELGRVAQAIGAWRMPTSFHAYPTNLADLVTFSHAQLRAYTGIATAHFLRGDYAGALRWAEAAEGLYNDLTHVLLRHMGGVMPGVGEGRAYNLVALGTARAIVRRDLKAGVAETEAAERFFVAHRRTFGRTVVRAMQALAALRVGDLDEARRRSREGERLAAEAGLGHMVWWLAAERGRAEFAFGRRAEAEQALRQAQHGLEAASGALAGGEAKLKFAVGKEEVTRLLVRLDLERDDHAALFRDLERARARAFVDMLGERAVGRGREDALVAGIRTLDRAIVRQRLLNGAAGGTPDGAQREAALLAQRRERVQQLRARDPELADTLSVNVVELKTVQARLRPGEVLAYALPADETEALRLLLIEPQRTRLLATDLTPQHLAKRLGETARPATGAPARYAKPAVAGTDPRSLAVRPRPGAGDAPALREIARGLRLPQWGAGRALYVVPTGALHAVPWGALEVNHPVAVLPTGGWLVRATAPARAAPGAAVVGDAEYHGAYAPLPGARMEAVAVAQRYRSRPLLGRDATEEALRAQVGEGVEVLHLATHGYFDAARPLASAIVLSGRTQPALLTAERLFEAPLPARLVVLSACETGVGRAVAGDDLLGLPRSFYLGGTHAVVSSLWPVDDAGTRLFMEVFHERARDGDYGAAWLAARDRLRTEGWPASVYGAFVLGGALRGGAWQGKSGLDGNIIRATQLEAIAAK